MEPQGLPLRRPGQGGERLFLIELAEATVETNGQTVRSCPGSVRVHLGLLAGFGLLPQLHCARSQNVISRVKRSLTTGLEPFSTRATV